MKSIIRIIQFLVALLFIVSGLVKANDPLGLAYKMQEFFELWTSSLSAGHFFLKGPLISLLEALHNHALGLSILMITLEIMAGVALLVGWKKRMITWLLLLLMLFFTFLTAYAFLSGKFTNCGCFGDCLPITPYTSFLKDILLTALVLILLIWNVYILQVGRLRVIYGVLAAAFAVTILIQVYALIWLPPVDCLPFKKGNNIAVQMLPPPGSRPDSFAIKFVYEKQGKRFEFAPENLPADFTTYKFIERKQELVKKGDAEPAIKGFALLDNNNMDLTTEILNMDVPVVFYFLNPEVSHVTNVRKGNRAYDLLEAAQKKGIKVYVLTNEAEMVKQQLAGLNLPIMKIDFTVFRTAARTNPCLYLLQKGTIAGKWSLASLKQAEDHILNAKM